MAEFLNILGLLIAIGVGMGCGSYATMPYYRLPNGIPCGGKWTGKKSACPKCKVTLRTRDLFPVLNWLWTHGKCFKCGAKVNPVYFFIEFTCTLLSVLLYTKFGFDQMYIITMGLAVCLVILAATQYSYQDIPDAVLIVMVMFGFLYRTILDGQIYDMVYSFALAVLCALIFAHLYEKFKGKKIKNYGLLKLLAVAGIWFGAGQVIKYIVVGLLLVSIVNLLTKFSKQKPEIFYGLALAIPFILVILV